MFQATEWLDDTPTNRKFIESEIARLSGKGIDAEMGKKDCKGTRLGKVQICLRRNKVFITRNAQGVRTVKSLA